MRAEVTPRVVSGRVLTGAVAQDVTRRDGLVRIVLTCMQGHLAAASAEGETAEIVFPHPVPVTAGERVAVVIRWAAGGEDYAGPMRMPCDTVLDRAHVRR